MPRLSNSNFPDSWWRLALGMATLALPLSIWFVPLPTYIAAHTGQQGAGLFSAGFIGAAWATSALGALISPLLIGALADRWFPANRIVPVANVICATALWLLARCPSQLGFWFLLLLYFVSFAPLVGLMNVICFRHLPDPAGQFPRLRSFNTLAWVCGGWLVGYLVPFACGYSIEGSAVPMQIASVTHLVAAVCGLVLPATPPDPSKSRTLGQLVGWDAIQLLSTRQLALPVAAMALVAIPMQMYMAFSNVFLNQQGVQYAAGHLAWGQVCEVLVLLSLPLTLRRIGMKGTMSVGMLCWFLRFLMLAAATRWGWFVWPAILLHGICFAFCFITLQMYVDQHAPAAARAAAQGLISMLTMGLGALAGARISAVCQAAFLTPPGVAPPPYDWPRLWMVAAVTAAIPLLILWIGFRRDQEQASSSPSAGSVTVATG